MRPFSHVRTTARLRVLARVFLLASAIGLPLLVAAPAAAQTSQTGSSTQAIALTNGFVSVRDRLSVARTERNAALASFTASSVLVNPVAPRNVRQRWFAMLSTRLARLEREILEEQDRLSRCDKENCAAENDKKAWHAAVERVRQADDPIREVQRFVHHTIRYRWDSPEKDHWQTPLETLARGQGDCEDHAILKRAFLVAAGVEERKISLVFIRTARGLGHVIVQVETEQGTRILDNRTNAQRIGRLLPGDEILAIHPTADSVFWAGRFVSQSSRS